MDVRTCMPCHTRSRQSIPSAASLVPAARLDQHTPTLQSHDCKPARMLAATLPTQPGMLCVNHAQPTQIPLPLPRLQQRPLRDTTVTITPGQPDLVLLSRSSLAFTAADWDQPQYVEITAGGAGIRPGRSPRLRRCRSRPEAMHAAGGWVVEDTCTLGVTVPTFQRRRDGCGHRASHACRCP